MPRRKSYSSSKCQFHQRFYERIFRTIGVLAAFSSYVLALAKKIVQKMCAFNVDEIDNKTHLILRKNLDL